MFVFKPTATWAVQVGIEDFSLAKLSHQTVGTTPQPIRNSRQKSRQRDGTT